jgi:4-coumarate--CoA ligase
MPHKSRWSLDIPKCSLPTFLFTSPSHPLSDKTQFLDVVRPDTHFLTRASYRLWAQRFALGLTNSKHFKKGDRILLFSGNDLFFPVVFMGVLMAGGIFTGANPTYVPRELAHQLRDSGATYLLCSDAVLDVGIAGAKEAGLSQDRVFVYNSQIYDGLPVTGQKGCEYWGKLVASPEESKNFKWDDMKGDDCHNILALNYSSGTTGVAKGVMITHYNYVANTLQFGLLAKLLPNYKERNDRARWLCYLPMYHAMAQTIFIAGGIMREIPVYMMSKFDFLLVLEYVQKYRITDFMMVPPIAVALAKHPAVKNYDLSSVESIGCGSAPLGRDVSAQVEALWPHGKNNMKQGWGMTE